MLRSGLRVPLHRERVELPDGDFVDLDFAYRRPPVDGEDRPLVLVLHGMEGSARSGYALQVYRTLRDRGIDAVGLNFRSCSGELNRLPRFYHSGETGDLRWVLGMLAERYPRRPLGAVGVSLGGNVLLKYLGESGAQGDANVEAAVACSIPFELAAGAEYLLRPGGRLYAAHLLRSLRGKIKAKRPVLPDLVDVSAALAARGFREFDDAATAPLHGFADAEDYYERSSSARFLGGIRVPTLLLHSENDPFLPPDCIPRSAIDANPHLVATLTARGGHVGFVAGGSPGRPVFWAEREAARFLEKRLAGGAESPG
jgi:predicted alpha/beta-fold hydrolase